MSTGWSWRGRALRWVNISLLFTLERSDGSHIPAVHGSPGCCTPCQLSHDTNYDVPTLEELGQDPGEVGPHLYPGGETAALARLDALMEKTVSAQRPSP